MSNIKVGDLVMVTRPMPCCGNSDNVGDIYTAKAIFLVSALCRRCGKTTIGKFVSTPETLNNYYGYPEQCLTKIDPPSLPETIEEEKELSI